MLKKKRILLGITGSIAAYKAIFLVRLLIKEGAEVKVIITPAAKDFVPVLTLSTLSKNKVLSQLSDENTWANHVMLGRWADVMVIAPLSCNSLSKMVAGSCDNLLMAAYLSATCPVVVAPAMDEDMWMHPSTKNNIAKIQSYGNKVISVNKGELASGLFGEGRMAEPEKIINYLQETIFRKQDLKGMRALVTAGPTYEAIDPVRFIGNHSSGKMGYAIAAALYLKGADVTLISGPSNETIKYDGIKIRKVVSAEEMKNACMKTFEYADIAVMSAAVADYKPTEVAPEKIKKSVQQISISLTPTVDILKTLGENKRPGQLLVGFALETNNEKENALKKVKTKNADLIVLNSLQDQLAGFGKDTNKVTIFDSAGNEFPYPVKSKAEVAEDIVDFIIRKLHDKT
jgi:phosphopantothenoylcysteine decarboxylase/phosphopantothenate--cysteine ligase